MGAFQVMLTPAPAAPIWLRARQTAVSLPRQYKLAYSTTSAVAGFTEATVGSPLEAPGGRASRRAGRDRRDHRSTSASSR